MIPSVDYIRILPEMVLSIFGIIVMMVDPLIPEQGSKKPLGYIAVIGMLAGLAATAYQTGFYGNAFYNTVSVDTFSVFFHVVVLLIALVVTLISFEYLEVQRIRSGEYYALILVRHGRHDADVVGRRTGADLHRAGDFVDLDLHSCRNAAPRRGERRSVAEVFPAGLVRDGIFPVRRGAGLRRYRHDQRLRHRALSPGASLPCWRISPSD